MILGLLALGHVVLSVHRPNQIVSPRVGKTWVVPGACISQLQSKIIIILINRFASGGFPKDTFGNLQNYDT